MTRVSGFEWKRPMDCTVMDHYRRSSRNGFTAHPMDRRHNLRKDATWVSERLARPSTRFVPLWNSKNLLTCEDVPQPVFLTSEDIEDLGLTSDSATFLGEDDGNAYFAIELPGDEPNLQQTHSLPCRFRDLRAVSTLLDGKDASLLAYSRAIIYWHSRNRYCGNCGSPTMVSAAGHLRICSSGSCGLEHFPRTDPAIIVLVSAGEYCLLGRQAIWPEFMYSTLAGFVEPGESLEDAVVREVWEETGIRIREVHYHSSQPWPFPASIMLGFTAWAERGPVLLNDRELQDAGWFTREDIRMGIEKGSLKLPSVISIAYHLIEDWFDSAGLTPLRDVARRS